MTVVEHRYAPAGAARALFRTHSPEILLEGPAGTGKTRAVLERIDALCRSYGGVRALICRATRVSMTQSVLVTLERDVLTPDLLTRNISRAQRDQYEYPHGSLIVCGGLDNPERLFSTEWDLVYVAEAIEITEDAWEKFARAMRNKAIPMGIGGGPQRDGEEQAVDEEGRPRFWTQRIADCNPGAPSHWLNQRAGAGRMARLRSRHEDNPSVTSDFLDGLRALTGHRRARLYEGRWVSAEGSVFPEFSVDRHVVTPFAVPTDWPQYVGLDPGYDHPCAILWVAVAPNGCLYVVDELYRGGLSIQQHAADIRARNAGRTVRRYYADPQHAFSSTAQSPKTIAMQLQECGLSFSPWPRSTNVQAMVEAVRERLRSDRLKVFAPCASTISEFQSWRYKRTAKGELPQGDDQYEDANNHCLGGGTMVHTDAGPVPIQSLVGQAGRLRTPWGWSTFYDVHESGRKLVRRWRFSGGQVIEATAEHRIMLHDGTWKPLGLLQSSDWIYSGDGPHHHFPDDSRVQRHSVLQKQGQALLPAGDLSGEKRSPAPGGMVVPSWIDPYGDACSPQGRKPDQQYDCEPCTRARGGTSVQAHDARTAIADEEALLGKGAACGGGVAQEQRGAGMALETRCHCHWQAVGRSEEIRLPGMRQAVRISLPSRSEVLQSPVQLAGARPTEARAQACCLKNVEDVGWQMTYDLSVEGWHAFSVNGGLVVSNSMDVVKGLIAARIGTADAKIEVGAGVHRITGHEPNRQIHRGH